jgi:hypothetical protein
MINRLIDQFPEILIVNRLFFKSLIESRLFRHVCESVYGFHARFACKTDRGPIFLI